jgi:probable DNA metabolism protein
MQRVTIQPDLESWRTAARSLLERDVAPADVLWVDGTGDALLPLAGEALSFSSGQGFIDEAVKTDVLPVTAAGLFRPTQADRPAPTCAAITIPPAYFEAARLVACHRDPQRWSLLYRIAWRLTHGERRLLDITVDDDVSRLGAMQKAVQRDRHKMTAFVRFRLVEDAGTSDAREGHPPPPEQYVAWHRPDHRIVRLTTPFFVRRFAPMRWTILTPDESVTWDGVQARFGPGVPASQAPQGDALEDLWRTYYANIFNPARLNVRAMKRELPVRHWTTLPETTILPDLLRDAPRRVEEMVAKQRRTSAPATPGKTPAAGGQTPTRQARERDARADCPTATSAAEFVPPARELPVLAKARASARAASCTARPRRSSSARARRGDADVRRRAARRPGGPRRQAVRRPRRPAARRHARRRPASHATRSTSPTPSSTSSSSPAAPGASTQNRRPARSGACRPGLRRRSRRLSRDDRLPRRDRRPVPDGQRLPRHATARPADHRHEVGPLGDGDDPPLGPAARPRPVPSRADVRRVSR